jgi:hypothetical protein
MLALASCKKEPTKLEQPANTPGKFNEIKTDPSFNWSTVKEITATIKGLKTMSAIRASLQLTSTDNKSIFYIGNHLMEEDLSLKIRIPVNVNEIKLSFGSVNKTYTIIGTKVEMDYIIDVPVEGE